MIISVTQYIDNIAAGYPEKTAYEDENKSISFSVLRQLSRQLGSCILQYTQPCTAVAVYMKKSLDDIVAFMGSIYAGCYYTPIDSNMPVERINLILSQLSPAVIIYDDETEGKLENIESSAVFVKYKSACEFLEDTDKLNNINICSEDLIYVLFTSGSTGIPKGVTISHGAVIDFIEWICDEYKLDSNTRLCNQAPFYFDASVPDVFIPLKSGATTFIPPISYYMFPKEVLNYVKKKEINTLIWVPSALCTVVNSHAFDVCVPDCVRLIIFCGEVMPCRHLNVWRKALPNAQYVNMYGPTEAAYACMYYNIDREFKDDEVLPLGRPCGNTKILLLDESNYEAYPGSTGEICILGQCLSHGYYGDYEKTGKAFVQNPLNSKYTEIMYKTGDLAQLRNGGLVYVGRKDFQIKKSGHRIELGEIESVVMAAPLTDCACCIYDEETSDIVMFYTGASETHALKNHLKKSLPKYMLPNKIINISQMPMNLNGKTDRKQLLTDYKACKYQ